MLARYPAPHFLFCNEVPSCCFVLDLERLAANMGVLAKVQRRSGAKILLALKAFAAFACFKMMSKAYAGPLDGTCASSVHEARLGFEEFGGEVHCFAAAFSQAEISELVNYCDHITFNSINQWRQYKDELLRLTSNRHKTIHYGIRINPEHSEGAPDIYNPCSPSSRLGVRENAFDLNVFQEGISGLHFHTLCEQGAEPLERTLKVVMQKFDAALQKCKWINFGGGHHITRADYNIDLLCDLVQDVRKRYNATVYLEPGEACALDAGWLTATVLDVVHSERDVAILDVSPACHMPDTLEMPYDPAVFYNYAGQILEATQNNSTAKYQYLLAGKSCLTGDMLKAVYGFETPLTIGKRIVFADMAIYSMVKTNTFNGLNLPAIGQFQDEQFRLIKSFGYSDFKSRLS